MVKKFLVLLVLVAVCSVVAAKPVKFNFATGEGFVTNQEVVAALGTTPNSTDDIVFVYKQVVTLTADCRQDYMVETIQSSASVEMIVNSTAVDGGYELTGYGVSSEPGSLPIAGTPCYAHNFQGTWTNFQKVVRIKTLSVNDKVLLQKK